MQGSENVLFGHSRLRRAVLVRLFSRPDAETHPSELAREIGFTPQAVARELRRLEEAGVVRSRPVGRALRYEIDHYSPVARELAGLVRATIGIEALLRDALGSVEGIEEAFIFGSHAGGEVRAHSDIDVLIVGEPNQDALAQALASAEQRVGREVNVVTYGRGELERKHAEGDVFVRDVLSVPRLTLLGHENLM